MNIYTRKGFIHCKEIRMRNSVIALCFLLSVCIIEMCSLQKSKVKDPQLTLSKCMWNTSLRSEVEANFTFIEFTASTCNLDEVIEIEGSESVVLLGTPTEIYCAHKVVENAGIKICSVSNLIVKDLTLIGCGMDHDIASHDLVVYYFRSAMSIQNCTNVTIQAISILDSSGSGLIMLDNGGHVTIENSEFKRSMLPPKLRNNAVLSGGSGLHIKLSYCGLRPKSEAFINYCHGRKNTRQILASKYYISNCIFSENVNSNPNSTKVYAQYYTGFGVGGGMAVIVGDDSEDNYLVINNCKFYNNNAILGGGLYLSIQDRSKLNRILVSGSSFEGNDCSSLPGLGGGVCAGFLYNVIENWDNKITFQNCSFGGNRAAYGGGGSFYFSESVTESNTIELSQCNWTRNAAIFGAALSISPHLWNADSTKTLTSLKMKNNFVISNYVLTSENGILGKGAVLVETNTVKFADRIVFEHNNGSALYLDSSTAEFSEGSLVSFCNNKGIQGGAVTMNGHSVIRYNDHSRFYFKSNSAQDGGGAIFQSAANNQYVIFSRTCFIKYLGENEDIQDRNTSFVFTNNSGTSRGRNSSQLSRCGNSILTTGIDPCFKSTQSCYNMPKNYIFNCIGNFTFVNPSQCEFSTLESLVTSNADEIYVVPGKPTDLNITTVDDFSNEVPAVYFVSILNYVESDMYIDSKYRYVTNGIIIIYGRPGEKATLRLESISARRISLEIQIILQECPPGYVYEQTIFKCVCSYKTSRQFPGIKFCNQSTFQAHVLFGYWTGYDTNNTFALERDFTFSPCFFGRCKANDIDTILPATTETQQLNTKICGKHQTGVLCSKCQLGYFMNYHSRKFICRPSPSKCRLGWLYYIVSELIPVTIFFGIVIIFDVRLTSGPISSLILFFQLSDFILIQGNGLVLFSPAAAKFLDIYFLLIGPFNMDFFKTDELSFCLWENARTLDLLAVKYITIGYALGLVVSMIGFLKYCNNIKCLAFIRRLICKKFVKIPAPSSAIHGITGFLIICYAEATKVSLLLLTPANLYSFGNETGYQVKRRVSACDGDVLFFRSKHLFYAIPALLILAVLGLAPPLLFFTYPLCYKLLGLLRISESRLVKLMCALLPLEKCKPFFDSFQSGFKDDRRFFAGLHFLYRLIILVSLAGVGQSLNFYILVAVQFLIMLALHATFQPLKSLRQNTIESLLFANLLLINLLTVLSYLNILYSSVVSRSHLIPILTSIQVFLLYLPLLCASLVAGKKCLKKMCRNKPRHNEDFLNYYSFVATRDIHVHEQSTTFIN